MRIVQADAGGLEATAATLRSGGVAVIPTDTVYGLAAHPDFPDAIARLYAIKARDAKKPIALLANDAEGARRFVGPHAAQFGGRHWPGALTVVARGEGVRVPDHVWTRRLIATCGGTLRVTSANLSGRRAATDAPQALADVGLSADIIVDDGLSSGGTASTVVRVEEDVSTETAAGCRGARLTVLRPGPVTFLTLASGSPRRSKILMEHGVDFSVVKSGAREVTYPDDPERTVRENALAKGASVAETGARRVLSADTIVWLDGRIFGKPRDADEARAFLRILSGRTHSVFTGVAYDGDARVVRTDVTFRTLDDAAVAEYVRLVNPIGRAGAYDVDTFGQHVVAGYTGSFENIMGLPVEPLREWGIVRA